jgi:hypothetical protein
MITPQLYDTIELLIDVPEHNLRAGARGAVVHRHADDLFEIEFATEAGETTALFALYANQFIVIWRAETEEWVPVADQITQIVTNLSTASREEVRDFAHFLTIKEHSQPFMPA